MADLRDGILELILIIKNKLLSGKYDSIINYKFKNFLLCQRRSSFAELLKHIKVPVDTWSNGDAEVLKNFIYKLANQSDYELPQGAAEDIFIDKIINGFTAIIAFDKMATALKTGDAGNKKQFDWGNTKVELFKVEFLANNEFDTIVFEFVPIDPELKNHIVKVAFYFVQYVSNWKDLKFSVNVYHVAGHYYGKSSGFETTLSEFKFSTLAEHIKNVVE